MPRCLVGLGANLDGPLAALDEALRRLADLPGTTLLDCSRPVVSRPVGAPDQDLYRNAAALLETDLAPHVLLDRLLEIEDAMGRLRATRWGARRIDLDLLLMDRQVVFDPPRLLLPHPWLLVRRFALGPASELWSRAEHPLVNRPLDELLACHDRSALALAGGPEAERRRIAQQAVAELRRRDPRAPIVVADDEPAARAAVGRGDAVIAWRPLEAPPLRAIVTLESPRAVYDGRSSALRLARRQGCPLLAVDPDRQAASQVVFAWESLGPLVEPPA